MSTLAEQQAVSRRHFLKTALAASAGAAAAGTGAALLSGPERLPAPAQLVSSPALPLPRAASDLGQASARLVDQLTAALAENMRLQAELDAAQRKVAALLERQGQPDAVVQALSSELDTANARLGLFAGLLALYDRLDQVDVERSLEHGLSLAGDSLRELAGHLPALQEGLQAGQEALAELEDQIPLVDSGRQWLAAHLARLGQAYRLVEEALASAVEATAPFLAMLKDWFESVLKWLPFGMGRRAASVMDALTELLAQTPHTLSGLRVNVLEPLDLWLEDGAEGKPIEKKLLRPLRQQTIDRAAVLAGQAARAESVYRSELAGPVQAAVARRRALRQFINDYREKNQLALAPASQQE